jgi:hypothetical protein
MNTLTTTKPVSAAQQTQAGRERYNAGEQISTCTSAYERMGWMIELRAQADAATYMYISRLAATL